MLTASLDVRAEQVRRGDQVIAPDVRAAILRDHDAGVPDDLRHHLEVQSGRAHLRRRRVPRLVQPDRSSPACPHAARARERTVEGTNASVGVRPNTSASPSRPLRRLHSSKNHAQLADVGISRSSATVLAAIAPALSSHPRSTRIQPC
jgi:hypothetical protein